MKARRATVEDLPQLAALWQLERLPAAELEKRLTEFQVVVDESNRILASVGLQISEHHGLLHDEAVNQREIADQLRQLLWERILMVARNHSLDRIWTRLNVSFWRGIGFRSAEGEELESMPEAFGERDASVNLHWLRPAAASAGAIEKQFAMLRAMHTQETERLNKRVGLLKKFALLLVVLVGALVVIWAVALLRYGPQFLHRQ